MNQEILINLQLLPCGFTIKIINPPENRIYFEVYEMVSYHQLNQNPPEIVYWRKDKKGSGDIIFNTEPHFNLDKCHVFLDGMYDGLNGTMIFHIKEDEIVFSSREESKNLDKLIDFIYEKIYGMVGKK